MKLCITLFAVAALLIAFSSHTSIDSVGAAGVQTSPQMSFFVTSAKNKTGNLGGLRGADRICQNLAAAVGLGNKSWRAYLSAERDPDNNNRPTDAHSRIGKGPWLNSNGVMVAKDLAELHSRKGDETVFLDERGQLVPGNWAGSPRPNEHDILTGSTPEGTVLAGRTCNDWTSDGPSLRAQVGHFDGLGRGGDRTGSAGSWNSAHDNGSCADTAPKGGAGRFYCFATN
jgi:hypothetical protein